jgi:hypothetical protein
MAASQQRLHVSIQSVPEIERLMIDENLKRFATPRQWECYVAYHREGSQRRAAETLNCNKNVVGQAVKAIKSKAAKAGYAPEYDMTQEVPEPYYVRGVSTNYDADGNVRQQWVKSQIDQDRRWQDMLDELEERTSRLHILKPSQARVRAADSDLCNLHILTDYHLGMLAWPPETGEAWDIEIASQVLVDAFAEMIERSPKAETGIFLQLGDFLHYDSKKPVTPASGHHLDSDSRPGKVVGAALDLCASIISMMLKKYPKVEIMVMEGNHDEYSSIWLRQCLAQIFKANDRANVQNIDFPYAAYLHGKVMIAAHHGHKRKMKSLPEVFASEPRFREMWGNAAMTYVHVGHLHHTSEIKSEGGGATVEMHNTLAARDAYATEGGWVSERKTNCITYHKTEGEISRVTVRPKLQ